MIVIFEYGHGSIRFTVEADSVEAAKSKINTYLDSMVDKSRNVDCGFVVGSDDWISEVDYKSWFTGKFKSTVVNDDVHISYK